MVILDSDDQYTINLSSYYQNAMPSTLDLLYNRGQQATGSLQSWHANEYEVRGDPPHIRELPNPAAGPLPMFPMLDVMPGSSSAYNDGMEMSEWHSYIQRGNNHVKNGDIDFEMSHGALQGFKVSSIHIYITYILQRKILTLLKTGTSNLGFEELPQPREFSLLNREVLETVPVDAVDHALAEATHGWNAVDNATLNLQKQLNFNHNRGFIGIDESGRRRGLEQYWNKSRLPDIPRNVPLDADEAIGVDRQDDIQINDEEVRPESIAAQGVVG